MTDCIFVVTGVTTEVDEPRELGVLVDGGAFEASVALGLGAAAVCVVVPAGTVVSVAGTV